MMMTTEIEPEQLSTPSTSPYSKLDIESATHILTRSTPNTVLDATNNIFINICDVGVSNRDASGKNKIGSRGNFYVIPHHAVVIREMGQCGAQYLHPIFWKKPSNHSSQFGANARFCGTYPYPRNCHVPSEVEYILHFRKNGVWKKVDKSIKERSRVSKERWLELSSQIWEFNGSKNKNHPPPISN